MSATEIATDALIAYSIGFVTATITFRRLWRRRIRHKHTWELVEKIQAQHYMYVEYKCMCGEGRVTKL